MGVRIRDAQPGGKANDREGERPRATAIQIAAQ